MQNQLTKDLSNNKIYDSYMFYGDSFLVDYFTNLVAKKVDVLSDSTTKIYFDEYDFKSCKNRLLESSLFSPKNVLIIKIDKVIPKKELDELIAATNQNKDSYLILACYGDSEFKTMETNFKKSKNVYSLRVFAPYPNEALGILIEHSRQIGLKCDTGTLNHLLLIHRFDLNLCFKDIEKLAILNEEITIKTVDNHCYAMSAISFEDFFYSMLMGQDISKEAEFILENGDNLIFWVSQIISGLQQILMINSYIKLNGTVDLFGAIGYNLPPKIAKQKTTLATKLKPQKILELCDFMYEVELNLKSSKISDQEAYFYASIRRISGLL